MSNAKGIGAKLTLGTASAIMGKSAREMAKTRAVFIRPGVWADIITGMALMKPATLLVTTRKV